MQRHACLLFAHDIYQHVLRLTACVACDAGPSRTDVRPVHRIRIRTVPVAPGSYHHHSQNQCGFLAFTRYLSYEKAFYGQLRIPLRRYIGPYHVLDFGRDATGRVTMLATRALLVGTLEMMKTPRGEGNILSNILRH